MVRAVGLLLSLLTRAAASRPGEVVISSDQPVRLVHAQGFAATLGDPLPGDAVFDALAEVLSTEQQADLALGEPVKFDLMVGEATWHLIGETASEVTLVRARPGEGAYESADSVSIAIDADEPEADAPRTRRRPPSGPSDLELEIQLDDEAGDERAGVRLAALRPLVEASEPRMKWPRQSATANATWSRAESPRRRPSAAPRPVPRVEGREDLETIALAAPAGTLVFLHRGRGQGLELARQLGWPTLPIKPGDSPESLVERCDGLAEGAALILDAEDPSPWLAWLLRRVEEGRRVLVETRAPTPSGARRILLGVTASPRAESWLASLRVVHATLVRGEWTLLAPDA